MFLEVDAT